MTAQGARVTGIDMAAMIAKAEELPKSGDETYLVGTAQAPPVESGRADLALYLASFHHIPENEMPALSKNAGESSRAKAL